MPDILALVVLTPHRRSLKEPFWSSDLPSGEAVLSTLIGSLTAIVELRRVLIVVHVDDVSLLSSFASTHKPSAIPVAVLASPYVNPLRAVAAAMAADPSADTALICYESCSLLPPVAIRKLLAGHRRSDAALTIPAPPVTRDTAAVVSRQLCLACANGSSSFRDPFRLNRTLKTQGLALGMPCAEIDVLTDAEIPLCPRVLRTDLDPLAAVGRYTTADEAWTHNRVSTLAAREREGAEDIARRFRATTKPARLNVTRAKPGILVTSSASTLAGAQRAWLELASVIRKKTDHVFSFVVGRPGVFADALEAQGTPVFRARSGLSVFDPYDVELMFRLMKSGAFRILHCDGDEGNWWGPIAAHLGLGFVQHMRSTEPHGYWSALLTADAVLAVSQNVRARVELATGNSTRVSVVRDGIDTCYWSPQAGSSSAARAELNLPRDGKIVLLPARITPAKRQDLALTILEILRQSGDYHLVLCGEPDDTGQYYDYLRDQVSIRQLTPHVTFLPFARDMRPVYRSTDVALALSQSDALGMSILESSAQGVCTVAVKAAGVAEFEGLPSVTFVGRTADAAEVADTIRRAVTEDVYGPTNREWPAAIRAAWSPEACVSGICAVYETVESEVLMRYSAPPAAGRGVMSRAASE